MVRVGGGWDTLEHFLTRHGGDDAPKISPSDLLPTDTRPQRTEPRTKGSPTSGNSPESSPNKSFSRSPSMSQLPPLRRAVSITPVSVSRRSSTSSPEPWTGNHSSGDSGCGSSDRGSTPRREGQLLLTVSTKKRSPRRSSLCGPSPAVSTQSIGGVGSGGSGGGVGRIPLSSRRSLMTESGGKLKPINRSSLGLNSTTATNGNNLSHESVKTSIAASNHSHNHGNKNLSPSSQSSKANNSTGLTPTSTTAFATPKSTLSTPKSILGTPKSMIPTPKRYINYLSSSQHIKSGTRSVSLVNSPSSPLISSGGGSSTIPPLTGDHPSLLTNDSPMEDGKSGTLNTRSSLKAF